MDIKDQEIYKEYKIARDKIQLVDAFITEIVLNKMADKVNSNCSSEFSLSQRVDIESKKKSGFLKVGIRMNDKNTQETLVDIEITCKGIFIYTGNIEKTELEHLIDIQTVPQLYPYIRSAVSTLFSMMSISNIILPTIDIIKGIRNNQKQ